MYRRRHIEAKILDYLGLFPVVGLTGPRQSGKSTTIRKLLSARYRYVSFDDLNAVHRFHTDPERFMGVYDDRVIFDEIQRVPELLHYAKLLVDRDRKNAGKFVLTGSSQFAFMKGVSESLAGRIGLLTLLPFQYSEMPSRLREESVFRGGYPELVERGYRGAFEWYTSYLDTYLTRDVRTVGEIGDIRDFRRFLHLLAARVSQLLNMSEIARELGISVPTVKKWISILEASYVVFLLPPYHRNLGKRIIRSPKLYFHDTGLVAHLTGIRNRELFEHGPLEGALFENYIVSEVLRWEVHRGSDTALFFFRESNGNEIDLIIDRKVQQEYIEIKSGFTFRPDMGKTLLRLGGDAEKRTVVYRGRRIEAGSGLTAVPYGSFLTAGRSG